MKRTQLLSIGLGVLVLVGAVAAAAAFIGSGRMADNDRVEVSKSAVTTPHKKVERAEKITWNDPHPANVEPAAGTETPARPACDDRNIAGYAIGGALGALAGNQIGDGSGKTAATVAGGVGGALLGGEYIPTDGLLCK